jgi:hypothetical protein
MYINDNTTTQQHNITTTQQHNNTTTQQHNNTTTMMHAGRRGNRSGGADGITESRQRETRNRYLGRFPTREK